MTAGKTALPKAAVAPINGGFFREGTMFKEPCTILKIKSRPLFFCGLWFVDLELQNENGWRFSRKAMFASKLSAENIKIGDSIIQ